jgi:HEAT repeat protein
VPLDDLLHALRAADPVVDKDALVDAIEALVTNDPEGSRKAILAHAGDEQMRVWALGLLGDPADFDMVLGWHLGGLGGPAAEATLRILLTDPDEQVRKFAARGLARLSR